MSIFDQGFEFADQGIPTMAKNWGGEVWLFTKHTNGQWISPRKCTRDDMQKLSGMIHDTHGPVMKVETCL
jgi:hypothetical protein